MDLSLHSDRSDSVLHVTCSGEIKNPGQNANDPEPLEALIGPDVFTKRVALDLEQTTFIGSSGISWLISCHNAFGEQGGRLVVHSVPPVVKQVFDLLRLGKLLHIAQDASAAEAKAKEG